MYAIICLCLLSGNDRPTKWRAFAQIIWYAAVPSTKPINIEPKLEKNWINFKNY